MSPNGSVGKGGISRITSYLERASAGSEVDVSVFRAMPITVPIFRYLGEAIALSHFALLSWRDPFDVLHLNIAPGNSTWRKARYAWIARKFGTKTILHLHGSAYDSYVAGLPPAQQVRVRRFFQSAQKVVVCGRFWRDVVVKQLAVPADRVEIVYNGVPDSGLIARPAAESAKLICLGLIGERKGTDVLVEALRLLPPELKWTALVAGPGAIEEMRELAKRKGLAERIEFSGWIDEGEARAAMSAADIFVLPSRRENQPVAIVEAMAAGLPTVSTRIAAIPEVVTDGRTGMLVEAGDARQLADALGHLIQAPLERIVMGKTARADYLARFSIEKYAGAIHAIYRQVAVSLPSET